MRVDVHLGGDGDGILIRAEEEKLPLKIDKMS